MYSVLPYISKTCVRILLKLLMVSETSTLQRQTSICVFRELKKKKSNIILYTVEALKEYSCFTTAYGVLKDMNNNNIHISEPVPYHCKHVNVVLKPKSCRILCISKWNIKFSISIWRLRAKTLFSAKMLLIENAV